MDYKEFEGKSVDEAIVSAMKTFKSSFENLDIQVISEGSKGLFGLVGSKTAKILAKPVTEKDIPRTKEPVAEEVKPAPEKPLEPVEMAPVEETPAEVEPAEAAPAEAAPAEKTPEEVSPEMVKEEKPPREKRKPCDETAMNEAKEILSNMLSKMNMPSEIKIREDNTLEIVGDGSGLLIGKRGQTLDSLQFLLNRMINKKRTEPVYITLDTEGYRERHIKHLSSLATKMGQKAKRTGQSIALERMNPHDRRIVHLALKGDNGVNTKSIGEGVYKKVVIIPRKA